MIPADLHRAVESAFNAGDVDALVALYDDDAIMATPEGAFVHGKDAIREQWAGFVALGGTITMTTRYAVEQGDIALLSNDWEFKADGMEFASRTAEVARRHPGGAWHYVVDHPYGGADVPTP